MKALFSLILSLPASAFALTEFPSGQCTLEGFLAKATNQPYWYLVVNGGSESETRFQLASPPKNMSPNGQFVRARVEIPEKTFSFNGKAKLLQVEHLNPYVEPKTYGYAQAQEACASSRQPNARKKK